MSFFASYGGLNGRQLKALEPDEHELPQRLGNPENVSDANNGRLVGRSGGGPRHLVRIRQHACQPPSDVLAAKAEVIRHLDPSIKSKYVDNGPGRRSEQGGVGLIASHVQREATCPSSIPKS